MRKNNNTKKNGKERDGRRKRRGQKDGSDILFCLLCFTFFFTTYTELGKSYGHGRNTEEFSRCTFHKLDVLALSFLSVQFS